MAFKLPELPYAYDALEPHIDAKTMEVHHQGHHKTYTDKLNAAVEGTEYENWSIEDLLKNLNNLPENIKTPVRNNGGGYYHHNLYWEFMTPEGSDMPSELEELLNKYFGSVEEFKEQFINTGLGHFGSGRSCLVKDGQEMKIYSMPNQDSPVTLGHTPLLMMDMWEHAYYLKHQNKKAGYTEDFWNVINWSKVLELYKEYEI